MTDADDQLRDLYQELILEHGRKPRNFRVISNSQNVAQGHNPLCGDRLTLYVSMDSNDRIADIAFQGTGCAISMASASLLTETLKGKTREEAEVYFRSFHATCTGLDPELTPTMAEEDRERLTALIGVREYPMRVKCATLAWHTLQSALKHKGVVSTE